MNTPTNSQSSNGKDLDDVTSRSVSDEELAELEIVLARSAVKEANSPEISKLAMRVQKQNQADQLTRLSVHGIFSMLLSVFAPLFMQAKHKRSSIRQFNNDK